MTEEKYYGVAILLKGHPEPNKWMIRDRVLILQEDLKAQNPGKRRVKRKTVYFDDLSLREFLKKQKLDELISETKFIPKNIKINYANLSDKLVDECEANEEFVMRIFENKWAMQIQVKRDFCLMNFKLIIISKIHRFYKQ